MKKLLVLLFSILISFNSYGEWTQISSNIKGDSYFINLETIKKRNGYVYYWQLDDLSSPLASGKVFSAKRKMEVNCIEEAMRTKVEHYYTGNMGKGKIYGTLDSPPTSWRYPPPSSSYFSILNYACDYLN